jgi:hypothetical protein
MEAEQKTTLQKVAAFLRVVHAKKNKQTYTSKVWVYHRFNDPEKEQEFPVMESSGHVVE